MFILGLKAAKSLDSEIVVKAGDIDVNGSY